MIAYGEKKPLVIAHRGGAALAPENTLAAFEKSNDIGADYFELDVYLSTDDSLMIIHDGTVNRTTNGYGSIESMSYNELRQFDAGSWFDSEFTGEKIPTLSESLFLAKNCSNEVKVVIEIKSTNPEVPEKVVEIVQKLINSCHAFF